MELGVVGLESGGIRTIWTIHSAGLHGFLGGFFQTKTLKDCFVFFLEA